MNTCYSSRGLKFNSQHPHLVALTTVLAAVSIYADGTHCVCVYVGAHKHLHIFVHYPVAVDSKQLLIELMMREKCHMIE